MTPKRIPADPRVALAAWEVPSETRLDVVHHVAIRVGDIQPDDECPSKLRGRHEAAGAWGGSGRLSCWACRGVLWFIECDCEDFTLGNGKRALEGKPEVLCKHIVACREALATERRAERNSDLA